MSTASSASLRSVFTLAMASQSLLLWWAGSSWRFPDLPSTYSGRWVGKEIVAGSVSHAGYNSVFVAPADTYAPDFPKDSRWSERDDGHFCGFIVPPTGYNPTRFMICFDRNAISWTLPYWLMTAAWLIAIAKTRKAFRFNLIDALTIVGLTAITLGLIHLRVGLVATTLLNFVTATFLAWFLLGSVVRALLTLKPAVAQSHAPE